MPLEDERGVGAAEAEGIGENRIDLRVVDALADDRNAFEFGIQRLDMRALADEFLLHHQQAVNRFLHTGSAERVACKRLRRLDMRDLVRSEEHTSELQSLMRISYAVFCLKKKL